MARIRSVKPEIRRSLTVSAWPYPVRWTFVGLPGYLDDAGRGHDDVRLLKAELYPLDDDMTSKKLDGHLQRIADSGPLCRYEVDGQRYLHVTSWAEHQRINRPSPSRIPPCPFHEPDVSPHGGLTEGSLPRAQARVPAEQGAGKGAGKGVVVARGDEPSDPTPDEHDDDPARSLLDEHLAALGQPLSAGARTQLLEHVRACLQRATPDQTRDALRRYRERAATGQRTLPGLLPRLLDDVLTEAGGDPADDPEIAAWLAQQEAAQPGAR